MGSIRAASVLVALAATASVGLAQGTDGEEAFERYCGTCHGPGGKGDGVLSGFLETKPADLTQLAKKNGGEFPFHRTMRFIDGTEDVRAHGDPDMPVWGEVFRRESAASPTQQAEIRGKILAITTHLSSIQEK